jgi:hypothetical protein
MESKEKVKTLVARRNNYSFEKRQRENKRKKKQAEKLARKGLKKLEPANGEVPAAPQTPDVATEAPDGSGEA